LRPAPEFAAWLESMGITRDGRVQPIAASHPLLANVPSASKAS